MVEHCLVMVDFKKRLGNKSMGWGKKPQTWKAQVCATRFALMMGAGVFNLLHTFFGGILMFCLLYAFARWATRTDPQMLRFVLNSARLRVQYDPFKFTPTAVRRAHHV